MADDASLDEGAVGRALDSRYRSTVQSLVAAREEYRLLKEQTTVDVRALRKTAMLVHDLEQLQSVLARELAALRVE